MLPQLILNVIETARLSSVRDARVQLETRTRGSAWRRQTATLLNKFGFKRLGAGAGGVVYGHATYPYVIKAYRHDTGFRDWLNFVRRNQDNPWVPRLRGKNIRIGQTEFIRMERLKPISANSHQQHTAMDLRYAFELLVHNPDDVQAELHRMRMHPARRAIIEDRIGEIESDSDLYAILTFFHAHPAAWLDLHMGNWMHRDGQVVIIDPLYARKPLRSLGQS